MIRCLFWLSSVIFFVGIGLESYGAICNNDMFLPIGVFAVILGFIGMFIAVRIRDKNAASKES